MNYLAQNYNPYPVTFCLGRGPFLYDYLGKEYVDMMSAYSAVSLGHSHPRIVKRLSDQATRLSVTSRAYHNDRLYELAERLCLLADMDLMLPMNTGAEAVETAIKAARKWGYEKKFIRPYAAKIIVAYNNFHGRTTTIVGFSSDSINNNFGPFGPGFISVPFGYASAIEAVLAFEGHNVAAVLLEPIQGEAGIIIPKDGYLEAVSKLCKTHNVKLILDEVQTGLGRTGTMFACDHDHHCMPDAILLGKALGGGMLPISCMVGKADLMDVLTPGSHGSTWGGNPLACAVACETLDVIQDENLVDKSCFLGHAMLAQLKDGLAGSNIVKDVRGRGLFAGVELDAPARPFGVKLLSEGVVTKDTHENIIRLAPPLVIDIDTLSQAVDKIIKVIKDGTV